MHYTVHTELSVMLCNMPPGSRDGVVMWSKRCRSKSSVVPTQNIITAGFHRHGTKPVWLLFVMLCLFQNYFYFFAAAPLDPEFLFTSSYLILYFCHQIFLFSEHARFIGMTITFLTLRLPRRRTWWRISIINGAPAVMKIPIYISRLNRESLCSCLAMHHLILGHWEYRCLC